MNGFPRLGCVGRCLNGRWALEDIASYMYGVGVSYTNTTFELFVKCEIFSHKQVIR